MQSVTRGHAAKKQHKKMKRAATKVQAVSRGHAGRQAAKKQVAQKKPPPLAADPRIRLTFAVPVQGESIQVTLSTSELAVPPPPSPPPPSPL